MAKSQLDIIIDAQFKGKSEIGQADDAAQALQSNTQRAGSAFSSAAVEFAKVGVVLAGVGVAAREAYEFIGEGAQLDAARGKFDNLAASIGTTGGALMGNLKTATKGLVSDAELIAASTDIMNLGLAKSQDGVVRLATAVGALNLDMGVLALTLANDSTVRLDSLGLSMEDVKNKAAALKAEGFTGDAFDEAVLLALEEKMVLLGDASETTAGQMKILEANAKNASDGLKLLVANAEITKETISRWSDLTQNVGTYGAVVGNAFDDVNAAMSRGLITQEQALLLQGLLTIGHEKTKDVVNDLRAEMEALDEAILATAGADAVLLQQTTDTTVAAMVAATQWKDYSDRVVGVMTAEMMYADNARALTVPATEAAAQAAELAAGPWGEYYDAIQAVNGALQQEENAQTYAENVNTLGDNAQVAADKVDSLAMKLLGIQPTYTTSISIDTTEAERRIDRLTSMIGSLGAARAIEPELGGAPLIQNSSSGSGFSAPNTGNIPLP
jgi:hypothetical protein